MKELILIGLLILLCGTIASAQPQSRCFEFGALKDRHLFQFQTDGSDVSGSYFVEREYDVENTETYDFSGTRTGNVLKINFSKYAAMQGHPFEIKNAVLTLVKSGDAEVLKVKFYGKAKTAVYSMDMESCEPGYATLLKQAKRVTFAKGKTSAEFDLTFSAKKERKAFLLGAKKGQTISVESPGCGISFYYPDKTEYEEGTAIDGLEMELPQTGDYLFVIKSEPEPQTCMTKFEVTNKK